MSTRERYFLPYQSAWIEDDSNLKIVEKSRQIGFSYADSYDSVRKVAPAAARLDVWVSSRDEIQAKQYLAYCKTWAKVLNHAAEDLGEQLVDKEGNSAFVLRFSNGRCIYALSSNPDALAGKTGHIKLDEFALHKDQRLLYRIAKPCTTWGGQLSIISTHRGANTLFNQLIKGVVEDGNPMGWSHHKVTIHDAVEQGIVEKINKASGKDESREAFVERIESECVDNEQWLQEYCCIPADDNESFITYEMIAACEDRNCNKGFNYLFECTGSLFIGLDVGRKKDLTVIDVEERLGDVFWERHRIELPKTRFAIQRDRLYSVLELPKVRRACLDNTGIGMQLAEEAKERFGHKVEEVTFTNAVKEALAYPLKSAFEDRTIRVPGGDTTLTEDLRSVRKTTTAANNIRFEGDADDSHADRFWAKALALHAGKTTNEIRITVG